MIFYFKGTEKEIADLPLTVCEDLADALARVDAGQTLVMPLSRPMPDIGNRCS